MSIPEAVVEVAARAMHAAMTGGGPSEWGYLDKQAQDNRLYWMRAALEAAAPHMLASSWEEGHESGFWNGRMTHGDVTGCLIGVEHAKAHNPYRTTGGSHDRAGR